jgi:2-methylisocitrate lyase-like PEP mutase family enzyme
VNIEDGAREPADVADRIAAARQAADRAGVSLFINARTDVFLRGIGPAVDRLAETFDRARTYLAAGADGIFVPGVVDPETIGALTGRIPAPVNIMAGPGAPSVVDHSTVLTRAIPGSRRTVKP